jgi:ankyrin repeat protein
MSELLNAVRRGDTAAVAHLLASDPYISGTDNALVTSVYDGHTEIVELLLKNGANASARNNESIKIAAQCGHTEIAHLLLCHGADACTDHNTPIQYSASEGHHDISALLIGHGADPSYRDHALIKAAIYRNDLEELTDLITRQRIKVPRSSVVWCIMWGRTELLKYLITPELATHKAMQCAIDNSCADTVRILLDAGADATACDHTAIKSAVQCGNSEIIHTLTDHMRYNPTYRYAYNGTLQIYHSTHGLIYSSAEESFHVPKSARSVR